MAHSTPKSQSQIVAEIAIEVNELRARMRELKRNQKLDAHQQAAVLTVIFGTGPVAEQTPEQQAAVLRFLFGQ